MCVGDGGDGGVCVCVCVCNSPIHTLHTYTHLPSYQSSGCSASGSGITSAPSSSHPSGLTASGS